MDLERKVLILMDRDGTINKDKNYYLGSSPNWKQLVEFMPGVIPGLRLLNKKLQDAYMAILTNQSGVALADERFKDLTESRMHEVNQYILDQLKKQGIRIDAYFSCPYVDKKYVQKSKSRGRIVLPEFVIDGHPDLKPNPGMINKALNHFNLKREDCILFMIGDRYSDMKLAENANARGILVPSHKTREQKGDIERARKNHHYIASGFLDAAKYIILELEKIT
jgi:D-glycero-D-manno-heptose 1,7-bisphosphate phosphatase